MFDSFTMLSIFLILEFYLLWKTGVIFNEFSFYDDRYEFKPFYYSTARFFIESSLF